MADSKITALTSISTSTDPANDPLVIVDVSDTSMAATGTTKKVTLNQLLGASGTATLASATITGDLTVDTSTLKVDSANNRVGIGTASPGYPLHVSASDSEIVIQDSNTPVGSNPASLLSFWGSASRAGYIGYPSDNNLYINQISNNSILFLTNNTEQMRLNSTGLGVGGSPLVKLSVVDTVNTFAATFRGNLGTDIVAIGTTALGASINAYTAGFGAATNLVLQPNGGNVGIGVTSSAWSNSGNIDLANGFIGISSSGTYGGAIANNAYYNAGWKYKAANYANLYQTASGEHRWLNAAVGAAAGNAITFTQAMTLDASGNLLVAATSTSLTTGTGLKILQNSGVTTVGTVGSSSSDVDTTYRLYSSTASAYRFYVGYGGTVYATNTTISAISDARLKENVQDIDVGLGAILALKPRKFDWKAGKGKDIKGDRGFIAQEFEQVFPQLVDQWADEAPEGEAPYKSVRQDLIPVLVKAIQELTARVQTLETR